MFRLVHISDVHLAPLPKPSFWQLCSKRITGYLNWRIKRSGAMQDNCLDALLEDIKGQAYDHLAVSGDLVNLALPKEFENAERWLNALGKGDDVSVILGNHDAYLPSSYARAVDHFKAYMTSDDKSEFDGFPYCRVRNGVAIIGLNSAEATLPFMATGYFRKHQAKRLRELLIKTKAQGLYRIIMIHHPPIKGATPYHKRLIGIKLFQSVIRDAGAELILHGHTHLDTLTHIEGEHENGMRRQVPVLCVPAGGQSLGGHKPAARYNLLEIDKHGDEWQCCWTSRGLVASSDKTEPHKIETIEHKLL